MTDYLPTVADIETHPSGELADIGLLHSDKYLTFGNWADFITYLTIQGTKQYGREKKPKHPELREIWAHYGGGFDWLHLIEWFQEHKEEYGHILIKVSGGAVIGVDIALPYKRGTIRLRDSFRLMPGSLNKLAQSFGLGSKVALDSRLPTEVKAVSPELYYEYLETDCRLLRSVLIRFYESMRRVAPIEKLSLTIASQSMAVYKHFQPQPFYQTNDKELKDWMRRGYTGGRVQVFKPGEHSHVTAYDFNSLYPSVMAIGLFPCAERGNWTREYHQANGLYEIAYDQPDENPALLRDETTREFQHKGSGVYTQPEIEKLIELGGTFEIIKGYEIADTDCSKPFDKFVSALWGVRRKAQEEGSSALQYAIKILLNSLYGKFGETSERESFVLLDYSDMLEWVDEKGRALEPYCEGRDCYVWIQEAVHTSSIIPIASYVTAYARLALYRAMELVGDSLIYTDTDSVYFDNRKGELPLSFIGPELGQLKEEFTGAGLFLGKKLYGLDGFFSTPSTATPIRTQKVRIKGVKLGGNMGADFAYHDMEREWREKKDAMKITLGFESFPTLREVLTGKKKAAKLTSRSRTITPTY